MQTTLTNGLRVVHIAAPTAVSWCGFTVDCGTRYEASAEEYGLAHFIEHILFKGTTHRDSYHINQRMESVGGELNAFTTKENTTFYATFLSKDFPRACELLCDLIIHPTAPQHELDKEREVVIDEIESYQDTPSELVFDEFENALFAGHPLGHNILGTKETVRTFDSAACLRFIRQHYRPDNMIFFSYGSTPEEKVIKTVEKYAQWTEANDPMEKGESPSAGRPTLLSHFSTLNSKSFNRELNFQTHQSHVILGCESFAINDAHSSALAIVNNILGGPGMNSRLNRELREHRGLVYTVESFVTPFIDKGYFSIYLGCDHEDEERCLKLCQRELLRLASDGLSSKQLEAAKTQLKGQYGVATANMENSIIVAAKDVLRCGHVRTLQENCERIDCVTTDDILATAQMLFSPDRLCSIIIH